MILSAPELKFKRKGATGWHRNREFNSVLGDNTIREKMVQEVDNKSVWYDKRAWTTFMHMIYFLRSVLRWMSRASLHRNIPSYIFRSALGYRDHPQNIRHTFGQQVHLLHFLRHAAQSLSFSTKFCLFHNITFFFIKYSCFILTLWRTGFRFGVTYRSHHQESSSPRRMIQNNKCYIFLLSLQHPSG